nr:hypothetical protein CFP56_48708 [Quercus suber]
MSISEECFLFVTTSVVAVTGLGNGDVESMLLKMLWGGLRSLRRGFRLVVCTDSSSGNGESALLDGLLPMLNDDSSLCRLRRSCGIVGSGLENQVSRPDAYCFEAGAGSTIPSRSFEPGRREEREKGTVTSYKVA